MKKKILLTIVLSIMIMTFGFDSIKALTPEDSAYVYTEQDIEYMFTRMPYPTSSYGAGNINKILNDFIPNELWKQYGEYYLCDLDYGGRTNDCYIFDDYSQISIEYSFYYGFTKITIEAPYTRYRYNEGSFAGASVLQDNVQTSKALYLYMKENEGVALRSNVSARYIATGEMINSDMDKYENSYWKYNLNYQDFIISVYDPEKPEDADYPLDLFILNEHFEDTRILVYNIATNQYVAEHTVVNLDYIYDDRFSGFAYELKENEVIRVTTTSSEARDYYISKMYSQENIKISPVINGGAEYLDSSGISTSAIDMIDPPAKGTINSVVDVTNYGNMNSLFDKLNNFFNELTFVGSEVSSVIGSFFSQLNPFLRNSIISMLILFLIVVGIVMSRGGR